MFTDLQLPHDLPSIRLKSLKINLPAPPESTSEESCTVQSEDLGLEPEECQTPTSSEHKIPEIATCPPAPKKKRMYVPSCKRRISEIELFETVSPDEIEAFFKASYEFIDQNLIANNRTCRSP